jgi:plastocyanin
VEESHTKGPGEFWSYALPEGVYNIQCGLHPGMKGTVTIQP